MPPLRNCGLRLRARAILWMEALQHWRGSFEFMSLRCSVPPPACSNDNADPRERSHRRANPCIRQRCIFNPALAHRLRRRVEILSRNPERIYTKRREYIRDLPMKPLFERRELLNLCLSRDF
jgi:hypothetical protein